MAYDFNLTQINNTDTFKEWADKCNAIIDGLNTTDFVTSADSIVTLTGNQTITGGKTFQVRPTFTSGILSTGDFTGTGEFTNDGNFTFNGGASEGIINTPTFKVNSGSLTTGDGFQVIGSKGISFKSSSTSSVASLKFENAGTPDKIIFDYTGAGEGTFEIADGNKLSLAGSSPTIGINNYEWDLPATSPGTTPSYLKWVGSGNEVSWFSQTDLASAIVTDVRDILQNSNFTLPVTLIPVGTMIAVDARILDSWAVAGSPEEYTIWSGAPGWLVCNGQTLSYDEDASPVDTTYQQLVELLEGIDSPSGSTTLPDTVGSPGEEDPIGGNSIVYLIKYKEDDTTAFAISSTTGVAGAAGINLFDTSNANVSSFDIEGGKIGLNINTDDFEFGSGGELSLVEEIDTAATADTLAKRDSAGTLSVATPTSDEHATTKAFVDTSVVDGVNALEDKLTNELKGSVRSFPELLDGHQSFGDRNFSISFVDKYGRGVTAGKDTYQRTGIKTGPHSDAGTNWFNTFSPITDQEAVFERSLIGSQYNFFFVDSNDILHGAGWNGEGAIGQRDRGTGVDFTDYYTQYHGSGEQPYNDTSVETPVPAMLPQKDVWDANAITVDTVSYTNVSAHRGIIVKTKDGVGREYVSDSRLQGFVKYETDENAVGFGGANVPYTRGWLIISSQNKNGNVGNGTLTSTNYTNTGPQVFGLNSAGSSLWATFAITDTQRADGINTLSSTDIEKVNKRFHYFKENATKAGGLGDTDGEALLEWKSQLGFDPAESETFAQYSYYIKKSVISSYGTWLIIGKPGNESDNEIWFAGYGGAGQAGNGKTDTTVRRHVPVLDSGTISTLNIKPVTGTDNKVYKSHDANSPEADVVHGFEDFEILSVDTGGKYYIIRGDENNENLTTRFRLFTYEHDAYNALVGGGTALSYRNVGISSRVLRHHQKLKGVFDISVGAAGASTQSSNYILARKTTDTTTSATELDALPESEFNSVTVMAWGNNSYGQLGIGNTTNAHLPHSVSIGTADRPVDIIAVSVGVNSFIITENVDGNRSIRIAGQNNPGLADVGTQSGNTTTFTLSATIDANWWVKKVFVSAGTLWQTGYLGDIFIVAQSKTNSDNYALFAGGHNNFGEYGTSQRYNSALLNYLRIPFPEDPKNIIAMQTVNGQYCVALCKTEESGETAAEFAAKAGRVYGTGFAKNYLDTGFVNESPTWFPIDASILSI